jgi:hypothetical protein
MSSPWSFFKNIYVISLKGAEERRTYMKEMLEKQGIQYTMIDAVNGKKNPYLRQSYQDRGIINEYNYNNGVLGCLASHRLAWEQILHESDSSEPTWSLIMEDDVKFHPLLSKDTLTSYLETVPKDAVMIKLGYLGDEISKYIPVNKYWMKFGNTIGYSTICYGVRSDILPHLLKHKWSYPIDHIPIPYCYGMINIEDIEDLPTDTIFRHYNNRNINRAQLFHGMVSEQTFESQIFEAPIPVKQSPKSEIVEPVEHPHKHETIESVQPKWMVCYPAGGITDIFCVISEFNHPNIYVGDLDLLYESLNQMSTYPSQIKGDLTSFSAKYKCPENEFFYKNIVSTNLNLSKEYNEQVIVFSNCGFSRNFLIMNQIKFKEPVLSVYRKRRELLPSEYIGIHIRNTDYTSNFKEFIKEHESHLKHPFFLASDNKKNIDELKEKYGDNVKTFSQIDDTEGLSLQNIIVVEKRTKEAHRQFIIDSYVDLLLLGSAKEVFYSCSTSGYSLLAKALCHNKNIFHSIIDQTAIELSKKQTNRYVVYHKKLETYITSEHFEFCKGLVSYGWTLVRDDDTDRITTILSTESVVLFVTYNYLDINRFKIHQKCKIIYKLDDQHNITVNEATFMRTASYIISPYAYLLAYPNKMFVPYSCDDKYITDIEFNKTPINKILVSGCSLPNHYPFRYYVANLSDVRFEVLKHPGYDTNIQSSEQCVGKNYFKRLNQYICCFTDASQYRYILLKNFEICGSGSLLLTDTAIQSEMENLGFKDNVNCIFCNKNTLLEKVSFILDPNNKYTIDQIRKNGMELVRTRHLTSIRAKEFHTTMMELLDSKKVSPQKELLFTLPDTKPCILICGCKKYEDYVRAAIQYMKRPEWRVIGITGDPSLSEPSLKEDILTVTVIDTYEYLPLKIYAAIQWCYKMWPTTIGIFKTDDDIRLENLDHLAIGISKYFMIPYWGYCVETTLGGFVSQDRIDTQFINKTVRPTFPAATYCYGHGYWISNNTIPLILNEKELFEIYGTIGLEDVVVGHAVNKYNIKPLKINISYKESDRTKELLKKNKILVFMSDNRKLDQSYEKANYNSLCASINYEYCKKHGYGFIYYRPYLMNKDTVSMYNCKNPITNELRHASWSKLLSTSIAFKLDYDYIVYIDSDCIFKNFDQTIEEFIKPYSEKDILFLNNKPWGDNDPCAGFYICKVNEYTKKFIVDWNQVNIPEKDRDHAWEQDTLWKIYKEYNIGIIDSWMFQEKEEQFLRHVSSCENNNRIPYFSSFIKSKNINYEKNINELQVIEFDTSILH